MDMGRKASAARARAVTKSKRAAASRRWQERNQCIHRWSVFVAGRDDRPWSYCVKCGALHPGEREDQPRRGVAG